MMKIVASLFTSRIVENFFCSSSYNQFLGMWLYSLRQLRSCFYIVIFLKFADWFLSDAGFTREDQAVFD